MREVDVPKKPTREKQAEVRQLLDPGGTAHPPAVAPDLLPRVPALKPEANKQTPAGSGSGWPGSTSGPT